MILRKVGIDMKKVIEEIENLFAKYDCYSLHDLEEQSDSFGNSEYDKYYYEDLVFTKHSFDGDFCCFYETAKARPTHKLINTESR